MTITAIVSEGEEIIDVEFEATVGMEDNSYSDEYGLVKHDKHPVLESEITWDKTVYDPTANATIFGWMEKNKDRLEKIFINDYMAD